MHSTDQRSTSAPVDGRGDSNGFRHIGRRMPRADAPERLTGRTRFANDLQAPGALFARFVRSPYASARIVSIDAAAALNIPGVSAVLSARDLPVADIDAAVQARQIVLALDRTTHVGQPVAAVLAETEAAAQDGVEAVNVEYEALPPVVDPVAALTSEVAVLGEQRELDQADLAMHGAATQTVTEEGDERAPNVASRVRFERGDVDAGFREADVIVEREYNTSWVSQAYLEPQACTATVDLLGSLTVYASTQALFHTRGQVARTLGLTDHDVTVQAMPVGGGFGGKFGFLEPTVAAMAKAVNRPVRVTYTRQEEFSAADPAPQSRMRVKLGARRDGTLTTLEAEMLYDAGGKAGAPVGISGILMGSLYRFENLRLNGVEVLTHKAGTGAYRAPGAPQTAFSLESTVDEVARELGMDPLALRLQNAAHQGDATADGGTWPRIGLEECLQAARPLYESERAACGPHEGVGLAAGGWPGATDAASAVCRLNSDGSLQLTTGTVDLTGTSTTFAMIVAEVLGLDDANAVRVSTADTNAAPHVGGTGGSKVTYTIAPAVLRAAEDTRDQILRIASAELETSVEDLELVNGQVQVRGVPGKTLQLSEIFTLATGSGRHVPVLGRGQTVISDHSPGMAVHIARVRVDPESGRAEPVRFIAVQDVGRAINPAAVEAQMHGGAVQGVGWGLFEQIVFDDQGTPITASFMDYTVPKASQSPSLEAVLVEIPSERGPFGAKGVGEPPVIPCAGAWANAVRAACGARVTELPMTPERIWRALDHA
ncbi:MAG: xanthine dehydrogenase family protein molybdopterin-binding subunit [Chloroflexi bacterium]|nr:xanthine dehydrogenase family protein molybdopterin-binding subunit [Chloroflexota bacterium]